MSRFFQTKCFSDGGGESFFSSRSRPEYSETSINCFEFPYFFPRSAREGLCLFHPMNIPNFAKIGGFEC